jgi:N-acetylglucosamine-6-sulfatase
MERVRMREGIWRRGWVVVVTFIAICSLAAGCAPLTRVVQTSDAPNVVLVLTDDLDTRLLKEHWENYPNIRSLAEQGTTFENSFVTDSLCCPSRATILRGQYAHNHQIIGNSKPRGGFETFVEQGNEDSTVATWLQDAGYRTVLIGKYLNGYDTVYVPEGWDDWLGIVGSHLSNDLNDNGRIKLYDTEDYYLDNVLSEKAAGYIRQSADSDAPFFMWLGTKAPHLPATPAHHHESAFSEEPLPKPPSYNEKDVSDKPDWVRDNPRLSPEWISYMDKYQRNRLRTMLTVDEMVGDLVDALEESGELDNTYIFFTSDNGYHAGEHRLTTGKWTAYEEDIRVPLIVRGPGVPEGAKREQLVLNNDLAPTFAEIGGAPVPRFVDGLSLEPLLTDNPPSPQNWRSAFLVEAASELTGPEAPSIGEDWVRPALSGDPWPVDWQERLAEGGVEPQDWGRPALEAIRTQRYLYVEYHNEERELYDLRKDPLELHNTYDDADADVLRRLEDRLAALRRCAGTACRDAEDGH